MLLLLLVLFGLLRLCCCWACCCCCWFCSACWPDACCWACCCCCWFCSACFACCCWACCCCCLFCSACLRLLLLGHAVDLASPVCPLRRCRWGLLCRCGCCRRRCLFVGLTVFLVLLFLFLLFGWLFLLCIGEGRNSQEHGQYRSAYNSNSLHGAYLNCSLLASFKGY